MNGTSRSLRQVYSYSDSEIVQKWAIIVGISKYKDESLNLKYADRDAEELYKLLLSPIGGGFEEDHIKKLINEQATTAAITKALRSFVKKADKEDIFIIYFACHGSPQMSRNNSNIIYLLTHDTDPNDISGTALRMDEIDRSLSDYLNAEHVVIIADACHSAAIGGGIGGNGRRSASCESAKAVNLYLQEVSKAKGGVALLTSAATNESSLEDEQWGGGHGVFTHFLLQGMRGDADGHGQPKDGIVTVGELFDYVCAKVREATNNKQHPSLGTNSFDRSLPMSVTVEINVKEHNNLGLRLYELGWILNDIKRFKAAAEQFREAIRLSETIKTLNSEAVLGLGKALAASGDYEEAIRVFSSLIERDGVEFPPEALLYLGIAQAKLRDYPAAESTFEGFLAHYPVDNNASWVKEYIEWLKRKKKGRKYALLIGINEYAQQVSWNLAGCLNDVMFMKKVLTERYGFEDTNVFTLLDQDATCQGILSAFESLSRKVIEMDTVVVHYSGHSLRESQDAYLFVHDTTYNSNKFINAISPIELHQRMIAIPSGNKTLILDTDPNNWFNEMAEKEGNYMLLLADPASPPYDLSRTIEGKTAFMGLFTYVLTQHLEKSNPETLTYGALINNAIANTRMLNFDRTPLLIGDREQLVFAWDDKYLKLFEFTQLRNYVSMSQESINKLYSEYQKLPSFQPGLMYYCFGRAFFEKGNYNASIDALQTALQQFNGNYPEAFLALGKAQVKSRRDSEALTNFQQFAATAPQEVTSLAKQLIEQTKKLVSGRKRALLVGIEDYLDPSVTCVKGAVNDVQALKEVLVTKFDFQEEDIKVLLNGDATRTAIIDAFKQLVEKGREEPVLFYFAGNGSFNPADGAPTIISTDGRQEQIYDIEIRELAELAANNAPNLVTIIDAGRIRYGRDVKGSRTIPADIRERQAARGISESWEYDQNKLRIGFISILSFSTSSEPDLKSKTTKPGYKGMSHGILTRALIKSLTKANAGSLTYSQWFDSVSKQFKSLKPIVLGDYNNELLFDNRKLRNNVLELIAKLEQESIFVTIRLLHTMIEQHELQKDYPEGWLNLGIAYSAVGMYDKSIHALGRAVDLYTNMKIMESEKEQNPNAEGHYHEALYQLGRVLYESEQDFVRSVSELEKATKLYPENVRAFYYLGQAIRAMVERETLAKAEKALQTYIEKGAPLGHEEEVLEFLNSRTKNV